MKNHPRLLDPVYLDNDDNFTDKKPSKDSVPIGTMLDICIKGTKANAHYLGIKFKEKKP